MYPPGKRPTMLERYDMLISMRDLNEWIGVLEGVYNRTGDEAAFRLMKKMQTKKRRL